MKSGWAKFALGVLLILVLAAGGIQFYIEKSIRQFSKDAVKRFGGDEGAALIELVACESCPIQDRNHAVWTLGQIREKRALPVLANYRTHRRCNHDLEICQYELEKTLKRLTN